MKTAVDQLIEKMSLEDVCKYSNELAEAKEMEKEQKEKTYTKAFDAGYDNAKEYYNKTFKQQEQ